MTLRRSYVGSSNGFPLVAVPQEALGKEFVGALRLELSEPLKSGAGSTDTFRDPQLAFI